MTETADPAEAPLTGEAVRDRRRLATGWWLCAPALLLLLVGASGPLLIVLVYSFLEPGSYSGVEWEPTLDAWFSIFFQRDIFDGTVSLADAHLSIFWRSLKLSLLTTGIAFGLGFPTAWFIATRPRGSAGAVAVSDHHPVLDEPADPHLRDHGGDPEPGHPQHHTAVGRA